MVEHGIVLLCDGPPWPKHDAQSRGPPPPAGRKERERMRERKRERERERERENRSCVRAACFKLAVLYSANFSFERRNGEWRRDGPFGERCKSASHGDTRLTSA